MNIYNDTNRPQIGDQSHWDHCVDDLGIKIEKIIVGKSVEYKKTDIRRIIHDLGIKIENRENQLDIKIKKIRRIIHQKRSKRLTWKNQLDIKTDIRRIIHKICQMHPNIHIIYYFQRKPS